MWCAISKKKNWINSNTLPVRYILHCPELFLLSNSCGQAFKILLQHTHTCDQGLRTPPIQAVSSLRRKKGLRSPAVRQRTACERRGENGRSWTTSVGPWRALTPLRDMEIPAVWRMKLLDPAVLIQYLKKRAAEWVLTCIDHHTSNHLSGSTYNEPGMTVLQETRGDSNSSDHSDTIHWWTACKTQHLLTTAAHRFHKWSKSSSI